MKTIASWLSDPFLHLIGIGAVILAVGMGMSSRESGKGETSGRGAPRRCAECSRTHAADRSCSEALIAASGP